MSHPPATAVALMPAPAPTPAQPSALFTTPPAYPLRRRRRRSSLLGLPGKLVLMQLVLVSLALGSCCWLFANQSDDELRDMMGQQARLVAYTLSLASAPVMSGGHQHELMAMGQELLNSRNILYVAFFDPQRHPLALAHRYANFGWSDVAPLQGEASPAARSRWNTYAAAYDAVAPLLSGAFGQHVDVCARVQSLTSAKAPTLGYVVVGVSLDHEQAQLRHVNYLVVAIGSAVILATLPLASLLVYGIFAPIRQLVQATQQMAEGRLDIHVDIERADSIGELARSFEIMVERVRDQREQLASANAQLGEANRGLEQKVHQRTAQLEAANRRLSTEIAEKEDFLRAVSHDLNAPLRNIAGMAQMLLSKQENLSENAVHRLQRIQKNVNVEMMLINELLELSRIKTRRSKMELVDTEAMVNDLAGVFEADLRSKEISLIIERPLTPLLAERARIRQVFQNLIDNAIKYMPPPGESKRPNEVRVGCRIRATGASCVTGLGVAGPAAPAGTQLEGGAVEEVEFFVADTGIGIEPDEIGRIFCVFRRGRAAVARNVVGKGVGLSSVKSIIETYNGRIWVESTPGQGSTFRFTINGKYLATEGATPQSVAAGDATPEVAATQPPAGNVPPAEPSEDAANRPQPLPDQPLPQKPAPDRRAA